MKIVLIGIILRLEKLENSRHQLDMTERYRAIPNDTNSVEDIRKLPRRHHIT